MRDWFVDNNLSIYFGDNKTESILFDSKYKLNKVRESGELMILRVINKTNSRIRFLYRKKQVFISTSLHTSL